MNSQSKKDGKKSFFIFLCQSLMVRFAFRFVSLRSISLNFLSLRFVSLRFVSHLFILFCFASLFPLRLLCFLFRPHLKSAVLLRSDVRKKRNPLLRFCPKTISLPICLIFALIENERRTLARITSMINAFIDMFTCSHLWFDCSFRSSSKL